MSSPLTWKHLAAMLAEQEYPAGPPEWPAELHEAQKDAHTYLLRLADMLKKHEEIVKRAIVASRPDFRMEGGTCTAYAVKA